MDLTTIFSDEFSIEDLMAPSTESCFTQDAKYYMYDGPVQQVHSNCNQATEVINRPDVSTLQSQSDSFQTLDVTKHVMPNESSVADPSTNVYGQQSTPSPLLCGMNRNVSASAMFPCDEFLFDAVNRGFEEPKCENSLTAEYSDPPYTVENLFSPQKPSQTPSPFPGETRDAFAAQVHDVNYTHGTGMIPSVVDQGAETLAAAAVNNEHRDQSREIPNLVLNGENKAPNASRKTNAGSSRRRSSKMPKTKLHQRTEPYTDAEMETKRRNAIKAHKNREKAKKEKEDMETEISRLKKLLQDKEDIIQRLTEERRLEKANRIRAMQEELASLTESYNSL